MTEELSIAFLRERYLDPVLVLAELKAKGQVDDIRVGVETLFKVFRDLGES